MGLKSDERTGLVQMHEAAIADHLIGIDSSMSRCRPSPGRDPEELLCDDAPGSVLDAPDRPERGYPLVSSPSDHVALSYERLSSGGVNTNAAL